MLECNVPLELDTAARVQMLRQPWRAARLAWRLACAWVRLAIRARRLPPVDAVVVGYMGHFDVHLARRLWPRTPIVLDHLVSARDTAIDRRAGSPLVLRLLERLDHAAVRAADVPCVDTAEHVALVAPEARGRTVVVSVGAPARWFIPPRRSFSAPLRVVFFGSFTPLHGTHVIGEAISLLRGEDAIEFTMIGAGQDYDEVRVLAAESGGVNWIDWVDPDVLPFVVASNDVCLGIFGTGPKALRVVPNKVFQGAACGAAIVTSDTGPQRDALGNAAVYVPPGDAHGLASALRELSADGERVWLLRQAAYARADRLYRPDAVVEPLRTLERQVA